MTKRIQFKRTIKRKTLMEDSIWSKGIDKMPLYNWCPSLEISYCCFINTIFRNSSKSHCDVLVKDGSIQIFCGKREFNNLLGSGGTCL